jgi:hypothetical protein
MKLGKFLFCSEQEQRNHFCWQRDMSPDKIQILYRYVEINVSAPAPMKHLCRSRLCSTLLQLQYADRCRDQIPPLNKFGRKYPGCPDEEYEFHVISSKDNKVKGCSELITYVTSEYLFAALASAISAPSCKNAC